MPVKYTPQCLFGLLTKGVSSRGMVTDCFERVTFTACNILIWRATGRLVS